MSKNKNAAGNFSPAASFIPEPAPESAEDRS
jgi:hypothetical protein